MLKVIANSPVLCIHTVHNDDDSVPTSPRIMAPLTSHHTQAELALRSVHIDAGAMYNTLGCKRVERTIRSNDLLSRFEEQGLTFDEFCAVYAELRHAETAQAGGVSSLLVGLAYFTSPLLWISGEWCVCLEPVRESRTVTIVTVHNIMWAKSKCSLSRHSVVNPLYMHAPFSPVTGWLWPTTPPPPPKTTHYDIFLGGSCGTTTWRTDTAIPILR